MLISRRNLSELRVGTIRKTTGNRVGKYTEEEDPKKYRLPGKKDGVLESWSIEF
jgi:hypothetical protein